MNISRSNKSRKGLTILVLFLIVSIVLNGILFKNIVSQEEKNKSQISNKLKEKDDKISALEDTVKELSSNKNDNDSEDKKRYLNKVLKKQQAYRQVATKFITSYLNYSSDKLDERRKEIKPITTDDLLDKVAPKTDDKSSSNAGKELSSDPTFSSKVTNLNLYINDISQNLNNGEIMADVKYEAKSSEGKISERCLVEMELQTEDNGAIKVSDYVYYPIN